MRITKIKGQLASTIILLSLLTGTYAEREGMLGRLSRHRDGLEQGPQGRQWEASSTPTDADTGTLLSAVEEHSSRARSHSTTKTTTTCKASRLDCLS